MGFTELAEKKLGPLLEKHGFKLKEKHRGYLEYQSDKVVIQFIRNDWENYESVNLFRKDGYPHIHSSDIFDGYFISSIEKWFKSSSAAESHVKNWYDFFKNEGNVLLIGDENIFLEIENYGKKRNHEYHTGVIFEQDKRAIDKAWQEENLKLFIRLMDNIEKDKLPSSYLKKLQIAKKRVLSN